MPKALSGADTVPWYQSKTIIAIGVGILAKVVGLVLGYTMDLEQLSDLSDYLAIAIPTAVSLVTDGVAIWGRFTAKYKVR